jgi:hypothetical protein|tara:strand:- start:252 stop:509 length:258 start_codon:yes stop_codon:yes gene_type:complete
MNKVKVRIGLEVIIEGDFKDWTDEGHLCIESAVEDWVANSDPPALRLVCDDDFTLSHNDFESGTLFSEDIHSVEDLTHELEKEEV